MRSLPATGDAATPGADRRARRRTPRRTARWDRDHAPVPCERVAAGILVPVAGCHDPDRTRRDGRVIASCSASVKLGPPANSSPASSQRSTTFPERRVRGPSPGPGLRSAHETIGASTTDDRRSFSFMSLGLRDAAPGPIRTPIRPDLS